jgi:hypothetical protein
VRCLNGFWSDFFLSFARIQNKRRKRKEMEIKIRRERHTNLFFFFFPLVPSSLDACLSNVYLITSCVSTVGLFCRRLFPSAPIGSVWWCEKKVTQLGALSALANEISLSFSSASQRVACSIGQMERAGSSSAQTSRAESKGVHQFVLLSCCCCRYEWGRPLMKTF